MIVDDDDLFWELAMLALMIAVGVACGIAGG